MNKEAGWLLNDKYDGIKSPEFFSDLKKLENGEPLAYIIGWIPFLHTKIFLDSRPLIPRPETEYWVKIAIDEIKAKNLDTPKILDLCAGSGCIGVAVLNALPSSTVDFVEIDEVHHKTIEKNISENNISADRVQIMSGDLFEKVSETYDAILTNPPYIDSKLNRVDESVVLHEPKRALYGGESGMDFVIRIISEAPKYLNTGGILYIEHEPEQAKMIKSLAPNSEQLEDQFKLVRFTRIKF